MKINIPRGNVNKCEVMIETPTIPPSIMWFGTKNNSNPSAIIIAPSATIMLLMTILRALFFCGLTNLGVISVVCESLNVNRSNQVVYPSSLFYRNIKKVKRNKFNSHKKYMNSIVKISTNKYIK